MILFLTGFREENYAWTLLGRFHGSAWCISSGWSQSVTTLHGRRFSGNCPVVTVDCALSHGPSGLDSGTLTACLPRRLFLQCSEARKAKPSPPRSMPSSTINPVTLESIQRQEAQMRADRKRWALTDPVKTAQQMERNRQLRIALEETALPRASFKH